MIDGSPASREISLGSEVCLPHSATATQLCRLRTASAAAQTPVDCSELHHPVLLMLLFVQPLFINSVVNCRAL